MVAVQVVSISSRAHQRYEHHADLLVRVMRSFISGLCISICPLEFMFLPAVAGAAQARAPRCLCGAAGKRINRGNRVRYRRLGRIIVSTSNGVCRSRPVGPKAARKGTV